MTTNGPRPSGPEQWDTLGVTATHEAPEGGDNFEVVVVGQSTLVRKPLGRSGRFTIGRDLAADVRVPDPTVSREHAILHIERGGESDPPIVSVEDLGSVNGTSMAGQRLSLGQRYPLEQGNAVEIGRSLLMVVAGPAPGSTVRDGVNRGAMQEVTLEDRAMQPVMKLVERVAPSDMNVMILGETGTGKEVMAEQIHRRSRRSIGPFVRINCAALSETLLESELFGHERGAFTGAVQAKPGLLEVAHGGTVLLDEVGEIPLSMQVKLLRVIEERQVLRVGSVRPRPIDVRFLSATNREVERSAALGEFRKDLLFRLNGVTLRIPALRERHDAIFSLAERFGRKARTQWRMAGDPFFTAEARLHLESYDWPGNIRELRNVVERAVLLAGDTPISPEHLALGPSVDARMNTIDAADQPTVASAEARGLREVLEDVERKRIVDALEKCAGNQTQAAQLLGISRRTLLYRLDRYGIAGPRKDRSKAPGPPGSQGDLREGDGD